ncbi:MAG: ABC transporter ATP-binding protein/permease [Clostridia bacterium]|nr:ABC transporter ATP-binding protein/permease [Clostridia bacterium]
MIKLEGIVKEYRLGDERIRALDGVTVGFRKNEFVAILGPSGCGKTTLLNILGGLDRYDGGTLTVRGKSTEKFTEADWNAYRNHSVGFVFQSYNLIPHQTVLENVELSLTLSGISKKERRERAKEALCRVGLSDQLRKKPNQLSGGQMQRVAIARAIVNDPDIVLADEPTGALDSETSVQIMEILKEISSDRLVVMVTHNPDLARDYSTRIIRLLDGKVTDDSDPFDGAEDEPEVQTGSVKKPAMSPRTALSLSLKNLLTKKGRTFMTAFAGSIGIIGIALILSVSTGTNRYINKVQEDTLSEYPITIRAESVDMSGLISSLMGAGSVSDEQRAESGGDRVFSGNVLYDMTNSLASVKTEVNNLSLFKKYVEENEDFKKYTSAIRYGYDVGLKVYSKDPDGVIVSSDMNELMEAVMKEMGASDELSSVYSSSMYTSMAGFDPWAEMLPGEDGEAVSESVKSGYELLSGKWPEKFDEVVLVVDRQDRISDYVLYSLGFKPFEEMVRIVEASVAGEPVENDSVSDWGYDEIIGREFHMVLLPDRYAKQEDGTWVDLTETETGLSFLYGSEDLMTPLRIVGIVRSGESGMSSMRGATVLYTSALTDFIIEKTAEKELLRSQLADPETDAISGLPFKKDGDDTKETVAAVREYLSGLGDAERAAAYASLMSIPTREYLESAVKSALENYSREQIEALLNEAYSSRMGVTDLDSVKEYLSKMSDEELNEAFRTLTEQTLTAEFAAEVGKQLGSMTMDQIIAAVDPDALPDDVLLTYAERYMPDPYSSSTYEDNLKLLGYVDRESPDTIELFSDRFADKDRIAELIDEYNEKAVKDEDKITYTDYVALIMSSVSTVINAITYVLIAFVAISLVVSSIMIGIITYVSVLERTKEIGILRAIGASKKDVSRVFNAETVIVGFFAGVFGILVTFLLTIPINIIIHSLTGISTLSAQLPLLGAVILIAVSVLLTLIAGQIPSKIAARKDPVEALRSE